MTRQLDVLRLIAVVLPWLLHWFGLPNAPAAESLRVILFGVDGREISGPLHVISHDSIRLGEPLTERKWQDVVWLRFVKRAGSQLDEPRGSAIWLANGDRLIARATGIEDEQLRAAWRAFPESPNFNLPLESVRGLSLSLPHASERRDEIAAWLFDRQDARDELRLLNGDRLSGEVGGWSDDAVVLKSAGTEIKVPVLDARDIGFNPELITLSEPTELCWLVSLHDGSRVTLVASKSEVHGTTLKAVHISGVEWDIPLDAIFEIRVLRGHAVFLSDLVPLESIQTPFLPSALKWPLQRDRSVALRPLRLGGREFPKGLGMHSRSTVTFDLAGKYRAFHSLAGLDDMSVGNGTCSCAVEIDGRRVFEEDELSRENGFIRLPVIDVSGAKRLTLIVDFGTLGDSQDHVDWCDAVLLH